MGLAEVAAYHRRCQGEHLQSAETARWAYQVGNEDAYFWEKGYLHGAEKHARMAEAVEQAIARGAA